MIYSYDVKVLRALKAAQYSEQFYVYVNTESGDCYHLNSLSREAVEFALSHQSVSKIKNRKGFLSSSLDNLQKESCIDKPAMGDLYQVTYDGWQLPSAKRAERRKLIVTHVAFPSLVALITTILTLLIGSWLNNIIQVNNYSDGRTSQSAEYANQQLND